MKQSERQLMKRDKERDMRVYKRDDMIQKARFSLSVQEQRCVLYAISKIKPTDTVFQEYQFDIKDFYSICGLADQSYTKLKAILRKLSDRSWWAIIDDKGTESVLRWFSTVHTNEKSGVVTIKFHEDMMPFLLNLTSQNAFFTSYNLINILPMKSQYSPRLYELLKSYQKNNVEWFFELEKLKHLLECGGVKSYENFKDFRRFVLQPAVDEINKYTDLKIAYETEKEGRKVARITFYMLEKDSQQKFEAKQTAIRELDGQLSVDDVNALIETEKDSVKGKFFRGE